MQKTQNLQDAFLNQLRREKVNLTVFLVNGFQMHGVIRAYDGFTVVLDSDGRQQLRFFSPLPRGRWHFSSAASSRRKR